MIINQVYGGGSGSGEPPADGKTRLYIRLDKRLVVPLYWSQTVSGSISIDWGDGSTAQTFSGTGNKNTTHTYSTGGDYCIALTASSGTLGLGNGTSGTEVISSAVGYSGVIYRAIIGSGITAIGAYAFSSCYALQSVTVPSSVTSIDDGAFGNSWFIKEYHFQRTTPPTLGGIAAFYGIASDCTIYVPTASLSAYQSATNWSTFSSQMVGE